VVLRESTRNPLTHVIKAFKNIVSIASTSSTIIISFTENFNWINFKDNKITLPKHDKWVTYELRSKEENFKKDEKMSYDKVPS